MTRRRSILKAHRAPLDESSFCFAADVETTTFRTNKNVSFSAKSSVRHIIPEKQLRNQHHWDSDDDDALFLRSKRKPSFNLNDSSFLNSSKKSSQASQKPGSQAKKKRKARKSIF